MARILSLDDEPELLDLYRLILERRGFEYITTTDCYRALDILRDEPVDLFIEDLMHPGMDGWQILDMMQSDPGLCHIPVLVISSIAPVYETVSQVEHITCLKKPFSVSELVDVVEQQLERHGKLLPPAEARPAQPTCPMI